MFMSKKARAEMRVRQRRKQLRDDARGDDDEDVSVDETKESASAGGRKRKRADERPDGDGVVGGDDGGGSSQPATLTVPANLTPKESKKFRKDARRKARMEGQPEGSVKFVVEGEEGNADGDGDAKEGGGDDDGQGRTTKRKNVATKEKRSFPRINDLLAEHEERKKAGKESAKRKARADAVPISEKEQYVAIDCEMVGVGIDGKKSVLARASAVDWDGAVLLDTFVRVPERVTDFRTFVSGVRAKDIRGDGDRVANGGTAAGAMEPDECRRRVGKLLKDHVLVGHSLKNDLTVLMLDHPRAETRDTARYAPFMRPSGRDGGKLRPRKLRDLASERIGMNIQVDGESHSSVDDARAAMELFKSARVIWERELRRKGGKKHGGKK